MVSLIWVLVGVVIALYLYSLLQGLYRAYKYKLPPGPFPLPIIGNVHLLDPTLPHLSLNKIGQKYGKIFTLKLGTLGQAVFLQDIQLINQFFDNPNAHDRPEMPVFEKINSGVDGIGSCKYDHRWKMMTKALHKGLTKMSSERVEYVALHAINQLCERFSMSVQSKEEYCPRLDVIQACSAMFSTIVYGIEPESLDSAELETRNRYHSVMMTILNPVHIYNLIPSSWALPLPMKKRIMKCIQERNDLFDRSYDEHFEKDSNSIHDMIDIIVEFERHRDPSNDCVTKNDLFLSAWAMYLAGCDTLTDTTLWTMLYLCLHPDVQEKMAEEIKAVIPDDSTSILKNKSQLHCTRAAILEGMRLSTPVATGIPSQVSQDIQLGEYTIPKGFMVFPDQWHVHHNEEYWPEPFKFKPERFLNENGELYSNSHIFHKMPFIPFSRGKRPCVGQYLALDVLLVSITAMLRRFAFRLPIGYKPNLTGYVLFNLRPYEYPMQCIER